MMKTQMTNLKCTTKTTTSKQQIQQWNSSKLKNTDIFPAAVHNRNLSIFKTFRPQSLQQKCVCLFVSLCIMEWWCVCVWWLRELYERERERARLKEWVSECICWCWCWCDRERKKVRERVCVCVCVCVCVFVFVCDWESSLVQAIKKVNGLQLKHIFLQKKRNECILSLFMSCFIRDEMKTTQTDEINVEWNAIWNADSIFGDFGTDKI